MSQKLSKQFVYLNFNQTNFHEYDADFYENVSLGRDPSFRIFINTCLVMKHLRIGFVNNVIIISATFLFFQGSQQMHQQQQSAGSFMQKSTSSSTSSSSATTQVKSILKQPQQQQQQQIRQHGEEIGQEKLKTQIQSAITDIEDNIDRRDFADKENMSPTQQQQQQQQQQQMMFQQQQQVNI